MFTLIFGKQPMV